MNASSSFQASGFIDVLLPTNCPTASPIITATQSYSPGHYDKERFIHLCATKDVDPELDEEVRSKEIWQVFQGYIKQGIPVKISDVASCRRTSGCNKHRDEDITKNVILRCAKESDAHSLPNLSSQQYKRQRTQYCNKKSGRQDGDTENDDDNYIPTIVTQTNFPATLLDIEVTAQICLQNDFLVQGSTQKDQDKTVDNAKGQQEVPRKRKILNLKTQLNNSLTIVTPSSQHHTLSPPSIFYGQEDQMTMTMKLREVMSMDHRAHLKTCVAQESILSCRDEDGPFYIHCTPEGRLTQQMKQVLSPVSSDHTTSTSPYAENCDTMSSSISCEEKLPLSNLRTVLSAPAYLFPTDHIKIREVNFWFAPHQSVTNTHYDTNHNILVVLSGTKTVELSPPDSIRPSGVYSEHANHPIIQRPSFWNSIEGNQDNIIKSIYHDRECRMQSTVIVSVSAGDALFIPEGWWHRVESSKSCMAINYWFDHIHYSVSSMISSNASSRNGHMLPYYAREMVRLYIDERMEKISSQLVSKDVQELGNISNDDTTVFIREQIMDILEQTNQIKGKSDISCEVLVLNGSSQKLSFLIYPSVTKSLTASTRSKFNEKTFETILQSKTNAISTFSWFLMNIKMNNESHMILAIKTLEIIQHDKNFESLILQLNPACCYILSQIFEKHASSAAVIGVHDGVLQKRHALMYIKQGVEMFQQRVSRYLVTEALTLV